MASVTEAIPANAAAVVMSLGACSACVTLRDFGVTAVMVVSLDVSTSLMSAVRLGDTASISGCVGLVLRVLVEG